MYIVYVYVCGRGIRLNDILLYGLLANLVRELHTLLLQIDHVQIKVKNPHSKSKAVLYSISVTLLSFIFRDTV